MSLNKQCFLYSVATDAFYEEEERKIHKRLLKLYGLRKNIKDSKLMAKAPVENDVDFWKKTINILIDAEKKHLTEILDNRLKDRTPRELNSEAIKDRAVISLFESSLTRALGIKTNELTKDLIVLNVFFFQVFESLVRDGFIFEKNKYIFLTASAGQIRTKRAVFIREDKYNAIQKKIMCGLTVEEINDKGGMNPNKFLSYLALCNSATDVWEDFDIDRSIVVDDFETDVLGEVDHIDSVTYEIHRKETFTSIPHTDGCGMMLDDTTRMVRLPWVKGLLVTFPFDKFIEEKCDGKAIVYDIYGNPHDVVKENIKYIFTKSQFKLWNYYPSWECYKAQFKAWGCEACYCNIEEPFIPKAKINYQMLQTLSDIKDVEIERITRKTVEEINKIGNDFQTTMRILGATSYNQTPNYFQQGLMLYPELFRDSYHKDILKQTKKSLVKQAKGGRLAVNGRYQFLSPDLYAFCEHLFLGEQNPKGLLEDGEVYSRLNKNDAELACLRSPHLYREWAIRKNKRGEELDKWFGQTKCIYTSCHDLISRYLMFDVDGDKALVIQDRTLTAVAKRNMKDIRPLAYDLKKAKGGLINSESLYNGMIRAYTGGNIGPISNNITKVWNSGKIGQEQLNVVKWLCLYNNAVIDYAKTLWLPEPPKDINKKIKSYTKAKVPHFFIYAKDKEPNQCESENNSTMNRISSFIPNPMVRYNKNIDKFDYQILMNPDADFTIKHSPILETYDYWLTHRYEFYDVNEGIDDEDLWMYQKIREKFLELGDIDYIVNSLVVYCYTKRVNSNKKLLWACFGDVIVSNIKKNLPKLESDKGIICPVCGKRFKAATYNQICCSKECSSLLNVQNQANRDMKS